MYLGFYKLKEMPFRLAPDPRFMYWSAGHSAALETIRATRAPGGGRAFLIGERGAGKTALLRSFRDGSPPQATLQLDFPPRAQAELDEWLTQPVTGRVILCDNAQLFHESTLLWLLRIPDCGIVLAGEPALETTLDSPELAGILAPEPERLRLPPLTALEVAEYIRHRLRIAGGGAHLFRDEVCAAVHRETKGNPRLVNALCDAALVLACERELHEVGQAEIHRACEDLGRLVAPRRETAQSERPTPGRPLHARIRVLLGDRVVLERDLPSGSLSIGRSIDNDLCIDSKYVSRHHCRIVTDERQCVLEDVHSTNGLFVNRRRARRHHMRDGDVVQIGEHRLVFLELRGTPPDA